MERTVYIMGSLAKTRPAFVYLAVIGDSLVVRGCVNVEIDCGVTLIVNDKPVIYTAGRPVLAGTSAHSPSRPAVSFWLPPYSHSTTSETQHKTGGTRVQDFPIANVLSTTS
ncbi:hypothetical protein J6590_061848 [Homalodisca vitripennis]|nr:hypothetical protein J6590_061848 [Homalodisca vitripennis]